MVTAREYDDMREADLDSLFFESLPLPIRDRPVGPMRDKPVGYDFIKAIEMGFITLDEAFEKYDSMQRPYNKRSMQRPYNKR